MREIPGSAPVRGLRVAIVVSTFHEVIARGLLDGCLEVLRAAGVSDDDLLVARVPGALELPVVAEALARRGRHDALVVLGCVIQGDTDHYDFVCAQATRGCGDVSVRHALPVGFGLLTCRTAAQAAERAAPDEHNKGADAARAALSAAHVLRDLALDAEGRPRAGFGKDAR